MRQRTRIRLRDGLPLACVAALVLAAHCALGASDELRAPLPPDGSSDGVSPLMLRGGVLLAAFVLGIICGYLTRRRRGGDGAPAA